MQVLQSFSGTDGSLPRRVTAAGGGLLYGVTQNGGPENTGANLPSLSRTEPWRCNYPATVHSFTVIPSRPIVAIRKKAMLP